ncbi:hypothetical protein BBO99_00002191 [Phytophthora kernoviae]|uniref:Actin n=2 Tax=Phytophthora kernoviae TaxID=325452 RepID=A0A3R7H0W0_9STRA|nr:hypothetical protein G195_002487 [Phytophthora kernoviae 00238/432]KAG2529849.1 hypothetical protein JM16_001802 [Phytophthora kernoviae]KAG2531193.1 hypothetical protein JM18_001789 [Phytophthora kernoviae]RLN10596.1 hypothetical protein BBI17_001889 [Phytophthora kernoviae]RLN83367.1 hypothetical protein BBO99_00002191 [Phytophthora kernoviae]
MHLKSTGDHIQFMLLGIFNSVQGRPQGPCPDTTHLTLDTLHLFTMEAIVLDNGSGCLKAGFSGEDTPRTTFPACTGRVKNPEWFASQAPNWKAELRDRDMFVGTECQLYRDFLELSNPLNRGVVEDWEALERMWEFVFTQEMKVDPETAALPILCISSPAGSKKQQERMAQIMFESQKVCGFYFMQQCVLSLFASGRTRGLVVEVGHGSSHAIPIFEGYALPHAALHYNAGGMDISQRLHLLLSKRGVSFHSFPLHTIDEIKEATCSLGSGTNQVVGQNQSDETNKPFELPDGTILQVDRQTQTAPAEVLFKPQELGDEHPLRPEKGLHECAAASIAMCDKDLQSDLLNAVVLAGGTTMLPGFSKRFQDELNAVLQHTGSSNTANVIPDPVVRERGYNSQRKIAAWVGGSMFASLDTFHDIHITKQEWEEYHEAILDRKCF